MDSEESLGHGLAVEEGDLVLERAGTAVRLAAVRGRANLLQALRLRVLTPLGDDRFNAAYGLDLGAAFTAPGGVRRVKDLLRLNLVRTLSTDPRVADVREVVFEDEREDDLATDVPPPRLRRSWAIDVVLDTVGGGSDTLHLDLEV
jgi:hypothetical protein